MFRQLDTIQTQIEQVKLGKKPKEYLKPESDENKAINAYLNGLVGKFGQYFALPNALVHRRLDNDLKTSKTEVIQSILAMDLNGHKIGNSSILPFLGANKAFGEWSHNRQVHSSQTKLSQFITMVPFSVFNEAQLDIRTLAIVQKLNDETVKVKIDNPDYDKYSVKKQIKPEFIIESRHFTGACLFKVDGCTFLFDIDREEIKHQIFNAFLSEIPKDVETISDAYKALKPKEVLDAEQAGLKVVRQGEWFFIPVDGDHSPDREKNFQDRMTDKQLELRAGNNRPNYATQCVEALGLVQGEVIHSGREHRTITLKTWHKPIANTATKSFTLVGNID